jgi:hypothetical protein
MPRYFSKFPKLLYTRDNKTSLVTNLITRAEVIKGSLDNVSLFYEYDIQEGDTPEIIASKYYDDVELHWVVLLFNDIFDPFYDFPLSYQQFQSYIIDKYGSVETAKSTVHHYEKTIESIDSFSGQITTNTYIIDLDSYNALVPYTDTKVFSTGYSVTITTSKRIVDMYDYENELNESKRKIKLVKKELIPQIKNQFEQIMSV